MLHAISTLANRFVRANQGVAFVEFALLLPFMCLLYLGTVEVVPMISADRRVALTASTVANVTTQYASISASATMPDILNASADVLAPYSSSNATVVVSLITIDASGNATITWSQALNGTARSIGQSVTLPSGLAVPTRRSSGRNAYAYTPQFDLLESRNDNLYSSVYMTPRSTSGTINLTA